MEDGAAVLGRKVMEREALLQPYEIKKKFPNYNVTYPPAYTEEGGETRDAHISKIQMIISLKFLVTANFSYVDVMEWSYGWA